MPGLLVLDASAVLHGRAMRGGDGGDGLRLLEELADAFGCRFLVARGIYVELVGMSLQARLEAWRSEERRWLRVEGVGRRAMAGLWRDLRRLPNCPGMRDAQALFLAEREAAPLLSHDGSLLDAAANRGVVGCDLLDLAGLLGRSAPALEDLFSGWEASHPFRPDDWAGGAARTLARRDLEPLRRWLLGPTR